MHKIFAMKKLNVNNRVWLAGLLAGLVGLTACNKDLPKAVPLPTPNPSGSSIMEILNANANFSLLRQAVTRAGLTTALSDRTAVYTVFAPDDAAFALSGINATVIGALRPGQLDTLLKYHIVAGQRYNAASIPDKFPNNYWQSMFVLQAPSATLPPGYRMPLFISRRGTNAWANQIPVKAVDAAAANGVIHTVAAVLNPPSAPIWPVVNADPSFAYLRAAVLRADSGIASSNAASLVGALNNAAANLTVFAPTNDAFRGTLTAAIAAALIRQGVPPATAQAQAEALASTPDVFQNPALFGVLTATVVRGIVSYHVLGTRAFGVNLPAGTTNVATIGGAALPQLSVRVTAPLIEARGPGNILPGTTTPFWAKVAQGDVHFINGVVHVVDQVLLPLAL